MIFNPISIELFLNNKNITYGKSLFNKTDYLNTRILLSLKLNDNLKKIFKKEKIYMGDIFIINKRIYMFHQIINKTQKQSGVGLFQGFTFYYLKNIDSDLLQHLKNDVLYNQLKKYKEDSLLYSLDNIKENVMDISCLGNFYLDFSSIVDKISTEIKKNSKLIDNNLLFYMGYFNAYKNKLDFFIGNEPFNLRYYEKPDNFRELHKYLINKEPYCFKLYFLKLNKTIFSSSYMKVNKNKLLFIGFNQYGQMDFFNEEYPKGITHLEKVPQYLLNSDVEIIDMFNKKEYYKKVLEMVEI